MFLWAYYSNRYTMQHLIGYHLTPMKQETSGKVITEVPMYHFSELPYK